MVRLSATIIALGCVLWMQDMPQPPTSSVTFSEALAVSGFMLGGLFSLFWRGRNEAA